MQDFKKYYVIPEKPEIVYRALTYPPTIELWTGEPAIMSTEPDSEFSLWDGDIVGKNIGFEENHKIVQQWYFDDQEEPSIVTIKLHPLKDGLETSVELRHNNIPDDAFLEISTGWTHSYFRALGEFFEDE